MSLLMRPRPDGPIYEARERRGGEGFALVAYYAEPGTEREMTRAEVEEFRQATTSCGGIVLRTPDGGGTR